MATRREERKLEKAKKDAARQQRRRERELPSLVSVPPAELLRLLPRERIESLLVCTVEWTVTTDAIALRSSVLSTYNGAAEADVHRRAKGMPRDKHPLHRFFRSREQHDYAEKIGYLHNQARIEGVMNGERCALLHLAAQYPDRLYLADIELAQPGVVAARPFADQRWAGIGNGVFDEVLGNLRRFGAERGFALLSAHAADRARYEVFARHGFRLDEGEPEVAAMAVRVGHQYPLVSELQATGTV